MDVGYQPTTEERLMAWARLDDQFAFNPKVVNAGNEAAGIFARALCWSSANGTDGFIPDNIAALMCDPGPGATRAKRGRDAQKIRARLALEAQNAVTSASLWVPVEPGDEFHITGRKDSGRRPLPDAHVVIKAHGYYLRDFLHYNRASTDARAGESTDARANVQHLRAHKDARASRPVPSQEPILSQSNVNGRHGRTDGQDTGLEPINPADVLAHLQETTP